MQNAESINRDAIAYLRSVSEQISYICKPLFNNSPVTTCHYSRLYSNGRYLGLSTNSEWGEHIIKYGYQWRTSFFKSELKNLSVFNFRRLLWPLTKEDDLIKDAAFLKIGSGITFARVKNDYIESYNFAAEIDNYSVQLFYINNLSVLEDFMVYFQSKISYLLNKSYPTAISLTKINFETITNSYFQEKSLITHHNTQSFLGSTSSSLKILSAQELQCVFYLSQGKTAKEIARVMRLSPRTIEYYLDKIRKKTGLRRKVEIVSFFERTLNSEFILS